MKNSLFIVIILFQSVISAQKILPNDYLDLTKNKSLNENTFKKLIPISDTLEVNENRMLKNLLFGEIGGNGLAFSINYERYLTKNISTRIGYGFFAIPVSLWFHCLPLMINYNFDIPFEVGIGIVPYSSTKSAEGAGYFGEKKDGVLVTTTIGFKRINKGVVARFSLTPFYNINDSKVKFYGGISFGFAF